MYKNLGAAALAAALLLGISAASAAELMPDYGQVPTGWSVDRYAPAGFSNLGTVNGMNNVLGISISSDQDAANRGGQNASFYNTQGEFHSITGGMGDSLTAELYVPGSWANASNGARRTDMWGEIGNQGDFPVIGFTNDNGVDAFAGFRTFNDVTGLWTDLSNAVNYNGWNTLSIVDDGTNFDYFVNGVAAGSIVVSDTTDPFSEVLMQAYNFGDPSLFPNAVVNDYTGMWANVGSAVAAPEPTALTIFGGGLLVLLTLGTLGRRKTIEASALAA